MAQERYHKEVDLNVLVNRYGATFAGIKCFIDEHLTDEGQYGLACKRLGQYRTLNRKSPRAYPVDEVFRYFIRGGFRKKMMPLSKAQQIKNEQRSN